MAQTDKYFIELILQDKSNALKDLKSGTIQVKATIKFDTNPMDAAIDKTKKKTKELENAFSSLKFKSGLATQLDKLVDSITKADKATASARKGVKAFNELIDSQAKSVNNLTVQLAKNAQATEQLATKQGKALRTQSAELAKMIDLAKDFNAVINAAQGSGVPAGANTRGRGAGGNVFNTNQMVRFKGQLVGRSLGGSSGSFTFGSGSGGDYLKFLDAETAANVKASKEFTALAKAKSELVAAEKKLEDAAKRRVGKLAAEQLKDTLNNQLESLYKQGYAKTAFTSLKDVKGALTSFNAQITGGMSPTQLLMQKLIAQQQKGTGGSLPVPLDILRPYLQALTAGGSASQSTLSAFSQQGVGMFARGVKGGGGQFTNLVARNKQIQREQIRVLKADTSGSDKFGTAQGKANFISFQEKAELDRLEQSSNSFYTGTSVADREEYNYRKELAKRDIKRQEATQKAVDTNARRIAQRAQIPIKKIRFAQNLSVAIGKPLPNAGVFSSIEELDDYLDEAKILRRSQSSGRDFFGTPRQKLEKANKELDKLTREELAQPANVLRIANRFGIRDLKTLNTKDAGRAFRPSRLTNPETLIQLGFAGAFGGLPSLAGAAIGGASKLGPGGAVLGSTLTQAVFSRIFDPVIETFKDFSEQFKEAGLAFNRSILGIAAVNQANTVFTGPGGQALPIEEQLKLQSGRAKEIQLKARSKLLPLGIAGQTEATFVQGIVSALSQRGIQATPEQIARISELTGGAIQAQRPGLLENTQLLLRDIQDVFGGGPQAKRTILSQLIRPSLGGLEQARSAEDIVKALEKGGLGSFAEAAKNLDNPVVQLNKLAGALDLLKTNAGDKLLDALTPALKRFLEALDPATESGQKINSLTENLGTAFGEISAAFTDFNKDILKFSSSFKDSIVPFTEGALGFAKAVPRVIQEQNEATPGGIGLLAALGLGAGAAGAGALEKTASTGLSGAFAAYSPKSASGGILGGLLGKAGAGFLARSLGPLGILSAIAGLSVEENTRQGAKEAAVDLKLEREGSEAKQKAEAKAKGNLAQTPQSLISGILAASNLTEEQQTFEESLINLPKTRQGFLGTQLNKLFGSSFSDIPINSIQSLLDLGGDNKKQIPLGALTLFKQFGQQSVNQLQGQKEFNLEGTPLGDLANKRLDLNIQEATLKNLDQQIILTKRILSTPELTSEQTAQIETAKAAQEKIVREKGKTEGDTKGLISELQGKREGIIEKGTFLTGKEIKSFKDRGVGLSSNAIITVGELDQVIGDLTLQLSKQSEETKKAEEDLATLSKKQVEVASDQRKGLKEQLDLDTKRRDTIKALISSEKALQDVREESAKKDEELARESGATFKSKFKLGSKSLDDSTNLFTVISESIASLTKTILNIEGGAGVETTESKALKQKRSGRFKELSKLSQEITPAILKQAELAGDLAEEVLGGGRKFLSKAGFSRPLDFQQAELEFQKANLLGKQSKLEASKGLPGADIGAIDTELRVLKKDLNDLNATISKTSDEVFADLNSRIKASTDAFDALQQGINNEFTQRAQLVAANTQAGSNLAEFRFGRTQRELEGLTGALGKGQALQQLIAAQNPRAVGASSAFASSSLYPEGGSVKSSFIGGNSGSLPAETLAALQNPSIALDLQRRLVEEQISQEAIQVSKFGTQEKTQEEQLASEITKNSDAIFNLTDATNKLREVYSKATADLFGLGQFTGADTLMDISGRPQNLPYFTKQELDDFGNSIPAPIKPTSSSGTYPGPATPIKGLGAGAPKSYFPPAQAPLPPGASQYYTNFLEPPITDLKDVNIEGQDFGEAPGGEFSGPLEQLFNRVKSTGAQALAPINKTFLSGLPTSLLRSLLNGTTDPAMKSAIEEVIKSRGETVQQYQTGMRPGSIPSSLDIDPSLLQEAQNLSYDNLSPNDLPQTPIDALHVGARAFGEAIGNLLSAPKRAKARKEAGLGEQTPDQIQMAVISEMVEERSRLHNELDPTIAKRIQFINSQSQPLLNEFARYQMNRELEPMADEAVGSIPWDNLIKSGKGEGAPIESYTGRSTKGLKDFLDYKPHLMTFKSLKEEYDPIIESAGKIKKSNPAEDFLKVAGAIIAGGGLGVATAGMGTGTTAAATEALGMLGLGTTAVGAVGSIEAQLAEMKAAQTATEAVGQILKTDSPVSIKIKEQIFETVKRTLPALGLGLGAAASLGGKAEAATSKTNFVPAGSPFTIRGRQYSRNQLLASSDIMPESMDDTMEIGSPPLDSLIKSEDQIRTEQAALMGITLGPRAPYSKSEDQVRKEQAELMGIKLMPRGPSTKSEAQIRQEQAKAMGFAPARRVYDPEGYKKSKLRQAPEWIDKPLIPSMRIEESDSFKDRPIEPGYGIEDRLHNGILEERPLDPGYHEPGYWEKLQKESGAAKLNMDLPPWIHGMALSENNLFTAEGRLAQLGKSKDVSEQDLDQLIGTIKPKPDTPHFFSYGRRVEGEEDLLEELDPKDPVDKYILNTLPMIYDQMRNLPTGITAFPGMGTATGAIKSTGFTGPNNLFGDMGIPRPNIKRFPDGGAVKPLPGSPYIPGPSYPGQFSGLGAQNAPSYQFMTDKNNPLTYGGFNKETGMREADSSASAIMAADASANLILNDNAKLGGSVNPSSKTTASGQFMQGIEAIDRNKPLNFDIGGKASTLKPVFEGSLFGDKKEQSGQQAGGSTSPAQLLSQIKDVLEEIKGSALEKQFSKAIQQEFS